MIDLIFNIIFIFCVLNIVCSYIIYPILLKFISHKNLKLNSCVLDSPEFSVSILIPFVKNYEISLLKKKINSICFPESEYKITVIFINNSGNKIKIKDIIDITEYNNIKFKLYNFNSNLGKNFSQYVVVKNCQTDYTILTDSNTLFDKKYFYKLYKYLVNGFELFGGVLYYNNKSFENFYWSYETNIKINESLKGLWNTGLFGSNIIIKTGLLKQYPFNVLCDFSLPVFYQINFCEKVFLFQDLMVYEKQNIDWYELFKTKKRIVHRALYGLKKLIFFKNKFNKKIDIKLWGQLYFHKISRWLTFVWMVFIFYGLSVFFGYYTITGIILFFLFLIFLFRKTDFLIYNVITVIAAFSGVISFILKPALNIWTPTKK